METFHLPVVNQNRLPDENLDAIYDFEYNFYNHFHPYIGEFIRRLNKGELKDLLAVNVQKLKEPLASNYKNDGGNVRVNLSDKIVDFSVVGPYSIYNWELFFHIPLAIAVQLSKNQRFAEAQRWFHYIFDPTTDEEEDEENPTGRYWKFLKFRDNINPKLITELLEKLSESNNNGSNNTGFIKDLTNSLMSWKKTPFDPHTIAGFRPLAYQFNVVMKYLDNLIAWGDSLFRQFTAETINEATNIYVLAANILGERPQEVPSLKKRPIRTYHQLKEAKLDDFSNALIEMENQFPLNFNIPGTVNTTTNTAKSKALYGVGRQLFFCIPKNEKLLGYWDTVADRLFKIRHCMDIEGNIRQLPLFEPPIDPGMLIKAAAAGFNLSSIVSGLNQPVSNVRYPIILQRALELCGELRGMGRELLSAIEKGEAERLSLIRQEHEIKILELTQDVKYLQWKEAEAATESLLKTRESAYQKYRHYQLLLGMKEEDISGLENLVLDRKELTEDIFEEVYAALVENYGQTMNIEPYREEKLGLLGEAASSVSVFTGALDTFLGVGGSEHLGLNKHEDIELNVFMPIATGLSLFSGTFGAMATVLSLIPKFEGHLTPIGLGVSVATGGEQLSAAAKYFSQLIQLGVDIMSYQGNRSAKLGAYQRRTEDWVLQNNLAAKELQQIGRQVISSLIREQITKKEYENHNEQIENSRAIETFLKDQKYSNEELYLWMQGENSKVYYDCYKLAYDTAKKAEVTMKYELMRPELEKRDFIQFNYWDGGRKGLLSGEALYLDLKRLELAGLEQNKREHEITKHISLRQLDPVALLLFRATGLCEFEVPEWLFDLDCPGHYMRRIKSVSLSIPCVAGPYTGINCTLSLQKSSLRTSSADPDNYGRTDGEDGRFKDYYGAIQSIITSNAQNDSGLFELNLRDERFLPFEGAGAISHWRLELPTDLRQFDYNTISDVILHIRYTARSGGELLKTNATENFKEILKSKTELAALFSLRHDFPNEWSKSHANGTDLKVKLRKEHFPYLAQSSTVTVVKVALWTIDVSNHSIINTELNPDLSALSNGINNQTEKGGGEILVNGLNNEKEEVFLLLNYTLSD